MHITLPSNVLLQHTEHIQVFTAPYWLQVETNNASYNQPAGGALKISNEPEFVRIHSDKYIVLTNQSLSKYTSVNANKYLK